MFDYKRQFDEQGYCHLRAVVPRQVLRDIGHELSSNYQPSQNRFTRRNVLEDYRSVRELAVGEDLSPIVSEFLGRGAFPIRGILFDKERQSNWQVGWHQDQIIPVAERRETAGFSAWSTKQGVQHVRPPAEVLEKVLILRVHLDDTGKENGPLRVIPKSHRNGIVEPHQICRYTPRALEVTCVARAGDVLAMRPLLLHASSKVQKPGHRRVIHLEYAADPLPGELQWYNPFE